MPEKGQDIKVKKRKKKQLIKPQPEIVQEVLPLDLQRPVDAIRETPRVRARWVRRAFAARGWPNQEHPGTVRDFLEKHSIPCL